jgi:hypothetical protein
MALTAAQHLSCHEIANVIVQDAAKIHNGFGIILELSNLDELHTALDALITALDADEQTKVAALVSDWDNVRLSVGKIDGGAVGNISSASYSFDDKRARIKELFQVYVPVMHIAEALMRRRNETARSPSSSFGIVR